MQDPRNLRAERGLSVFDARQRFINSVVYELPFGKGKRWLNGFGNQLLGGWQVTGILLLQTGRPYTIVTSRDMANVGAAATQTRPNLVGNPVVDSPTPERWFNTAAFSDVLPTGVFGYGNAGVNTLTSDGLVNMDLGLFKNFTWRERLRFQFRTEFFNATNDPNFAIPDRQLRSASFGTVSATTNLSRQIQFGMKIVF